MGYMPLDVNNAAPVLQTNKNSELSSLKVSLERIICEDGFIIRPFDLLFCTRPWPTIVLKFPKGVRFKVR
jgi:hypothetical protein